MQSTPADAELFFPYMVWAHRESARTERCLSASGMPVVEDGFLAGARLHDLGHPEAQAQPLLRRKLAERLGVAEERVLLTMGASGGMHLAAQRWFAPGTRVLSEVPSYEPVRQLPRRFGAESILLERRFDENWRLDPGRAAQLLPPRAGSPGHIFITNPNNPTGARSTPGELQALAQVAERAGGVLVCCEVYMEFETRQASDWVHALAPNGVTISSLTKAFGLGSLRLGWMILGEGLLAQRERLIDELYLTYVDLPTPVLRAGLFALERLESLRGRIQRFERESKPLLGAWLEHSRHARGRLPDLGLTTFAQVLDRQGLARAESRRLVQDLQRDFGVDVVPGEFWGAPGWLRVGFGLEPAQLEDGLQRLERGLAALT